MPAPKGNKNAEKDGHEKLFRVRVKNENNLELISLMDTYERGVALVGYNIWESSPESDEINFIDWMKSQCRYHGIENK